MIKISEKTNLPILSENSPKLGKPLCKKTTESSASTVREHTSLMKPHTNPRARNTGGISKIRNFLTKK